MSSFVFSVTTHRADAVSVIPPTISVASPLLAADATAADASPVSGRQAGAADRRPRRALEWLVIVVAGLSVALLVRTSVLQAFYIPSESMVPTFEIDDRVVVDKLSSRFRPIRRGSIVVFQRPARSVGGGTEDLVKRVIAMAGDTVEGRGGTVYLNGKALDEPYLRVAASTYNLPATTIGKGDLWVMGDNRDNSADSRVFGPIRVTSVVGRVVVRAWPPGRIGLP